MAHTAVLRYLDNNNNCLFPTITTYILKPLVYSPAYSYCICGYLISCAAVLLPAAPHFEPTQVDQFSPVAAQRLSWAPQCQHYRKALFSTAYPRYSIGIRCLVTERCWLQPTMEPTGRGGGSQLVRWSWTIGTYPSFNVARSRKELVEHEALGSWRT